MTGLAALAAALAAGLLGAPGPAAASAAPSGGQAPPTATAAAPAGSAPLTLLAQSPLVTPGQSFDVKVRPGRATPPVADLGLMVAVYDCLSSVSAFDQSVSSASGPSGTRMSSTRTPVPLSGLPAVAGGGFDLSMPVTLGAATAPPGGFAIGLTSAGAQCGLFPSGVYPVRVELVDTATAQSLGGLTTHLVYAQTAAGTERLRVALVLPVETTLHPAPAPTPDELRIHPAAALAPPAAAATDSVIGTVTAIGQHQAVPLTLAASAQTVVMLASTGHQPTVSQLASLATNPALHEFASSPFVPVDASSLVNAGLQSELGLQVAQGVQVLDAGVTRPTAAQVADTAPGHLGTWFSDNGLDPGTLAQLQSDGYDRVVLPASTVSSPPTNGSTAQTFAVTPAKGPPMTALAADTDLSARFTGAPADPVLAAHQLTAELAQMYYEKPNDTTARGVVAMAPSGWTDDPAFVDALLGALDGSPIIQPVTTATLFDTLVPVTSCHGGCRLTPTSGSIGLPVGPIRVQRQRINGLALAAPGARDVSTQLSEVVLSGQSDDLRPGQQTGVLDNAARAVDAQLSQIVVAGDRTITLTSQRGRVPVTIVSGAPYQVRASLTLTSDKLLFANHSTSVTQTVTLLAAHTNVIYVAVQARASGLFKVGIVLRAPGGVVLSSGQVSLRSTATSVVGIVLSLGAVAVLVVWWVRTSWKRRRARRREAPTEATAAPAEPVVTG